LYLLYITMLTYIGATVPMSVPIEQTKAAVRIPTKLYLYNFDGYIEIHIIQNLKD
jgi:hypothetical protein